MVAKTYSIILCVTTNVNSNLRSRIIFFVASFEIFSVHIIVYIFIGTLFTQNLFLKSRVFVKYCTPLSVLRYQRFSKITTFELEQSA